MLTHSTSPNVAHPALFMIPHSPEEVDIKFCLTKTRALSQSSCLVISNCITFNLGWLMFLSSVAPGPSLSASRHPANTLNPRSVRCLASFRPNPVSHPVMSTDLSPTSSCREDLRVASPMDSGTTKVNQKMRL